MKIKILREMTREAREGKIKELRLELVKSRINASKTGSPKTKEIKKTIARLITINKVDNNKK